MTNPAIITLADGRLAQVTATGQGTQAALTFEFFDVRGQSLGPAQTLAQGHGFETGPISIALDVQNFVAIPLANGGFEVAFNASTGDTQGFVRRELLGVGVDAGGHIATDGSNGSVFPPHNFAIQIDAPAGRKISGAVPTVPHLYELGGGRFAAAYETFDAHDATSTHIAFGTLQGLYSKTVIAGRPDTVTEASGDITLTWNEGGQTVREVFSLDGGVLAARGVSHTFTAGVGSSSLLGGFDAAHDQIVL